MRRLQQDLRGKHGESWETEKSQIMADFLDNPASDSSPDDSLPESAHENEDFDRQASLKSDEKSEQK